MLSLPKLTKHTVNIDQFRSLTTELGLTKTQKYPKVVAEPLTLEGGSEMCEVEGVSTKAMIKFVPLRVRAGRLEILVCPGEGGWTLPAALPTSARPLEKSAEVCGPVFLGLEGIPVQLGAFGTPQNGISVVYLYLVRPPPPGRPFPKGSVPNGSWWDVRGVRMVRDPYQLFEKALARLELDVEYGTAGFMLVDEEFTVSELRRVHQAARNVELDPSNFRKRVNRWVSEGLVDELDEMRPTVTRPARLYRLK